MRKYVCDRCGKEAKHVKDLCIGEALVLYPTGRQAEMHLGELCPACVRNLEAHVDLWLRDKGVK